MGYSALAKVYDKLMGDFDYDGYYNCIKDYIGGTVIELAIGSGEFTKRYIDKVSNIVGVDFSTEMLGICAGKLTKYRRKCVLINDDLSTFKPQYQADTVLCICDGLNYAENIADVAANVKRYLKPNGYFIFDISSKYKLENILGNNTFYEEEKDICYVWQNLLSNNSVEMNLTIFTKEKDGQYLKSQEDQRQFIHDESVLANQLIGLGFSCRVLDGEKYCEPKHDSYRLLYILQNI